MRFDFGGELELFLVFVDVLIELFIVNVHVGFVVAALGTTSASTVEGHLGVFTFFI